MSAGAAYLDRPIEVDPRFASVDCLFFVIGAQKSGTTWLSRYFKAHPNVSVPEWKEHEYWNMVEGRPTTSRMLEVQRARRETFTPLRDLVARLPFTLHARRQRSITLALKAAEAPVPPYGAYADVLFENRTDVTRAAGEICPEYAVLRPGTFSKMAGLAPNVRFILVMRDPVSRFLSGLRHMLRKSRDARGITETELSAAIHEALADPEHRTMRLSRYDDTLRALDQSVPREQVMLVFFEELFDQARVREICDFLGVPYVPGRIDRKANRTRDTRVGVGRADRRRIAQALAPVYAFVQERVGRALPQTWQESAARC